MIRIYRHDYVSIWFQLSLYPFLDNLRTWYYLLASCQLLRNDCVWIIVFYSFFIDFFILFLFFIVLVEELLCLATWKDGSTKYMIGKLEHTPTSSDEDKYRCFVVGKSIGGSFEMAQSGDATCNGMSSPTDGSRTMKFNRGKQE